MNHLLDHFAFLIHRAGIPAFIHYPVLIIVGEKEQVLLAILKIEAILAVLAEDRDLARLLAFDLLVNMHDVVGTIQGVP